MIWLWLLVPIILLTFGVFGLLSELKEMRADYEAKLKRAGFERCSICDGRGEVQYESDHLGIGMLGCSACEGHGVVAVRTVGMPEMERK